MARTAEQKAAAKARRALAKDLGWAAQQNPKMTIKQAVAAGLMPKLKRASKAKFATPEARKFHRSKQFSAKRQVDFHRQATNNLKQAVKHIQAYAKHISNATKGMEYYKHNKSIKGGIVEIGRVGNLRFVDGRPKFKPRTFKEQFNVKTGQIVLKRVRRKGGVKNPFPKGHKGFKKGTKRSSQAASSGF